jgi:hypothetical protein
MDEITKLESDLYKLIEARVTVEQAIIQKQEKLKELRGAKKDA